MTTAMSNPSSTITNVPIVIIGAGPTGLGAAWRLASQQPGAAPPFLLVNETLEAGGTAGSWTTPEGFTFDYGGHVLFPHAEYDVFLNLLDRLIPEWHASVPVRGIWINGSSIPTPVQRNIHRLSSRHMARCLWSLHRARRRVARAANSTVTAVSTRFADSPSKSQTDTLHSYLQTQFGPALATSIMSPLNRKMWATDPRHMGTSWTGHRSGTRERNVADLRIRQVLRNWITRRDLPSWTADTRVRYPAYGGSGAIWKAVASEIPSASKRFGVHVTAVDTRQQQVHLSDRSILRYEHLITSVPLDTLLELLIDQPELTRKAAQFRAARVQLFGFGVRGPMPAALAQHHAVSVPSPDIPFWRLNIPSNFAPGNAPPGNWSLLCECSLPPKVTTSYTAADIERSLRSEGFLPAGADIISRSERSFDHGYPVPFTGRDALLADVQHSLEALGIYSRGRFGGWRYEVSNQDHAFMQGVEVIDRLLTGKPEYTYAKTW